MSLSSQTPCKLEVFFAPPKKTPPKRPPQLDRTCAWRKPKIWRFQKWLSLVSRPKKKSQSEEKWSEWLGFGWCMHSFAVVFVQQFFGREIGMVPWFCLDPGSEWVNNMLFISIYCSWREPYSTSWSTVNQCLARTQDIHIRYTLNNNKHDNLQAHRIHLWYIYIYLPTFTAKRQASM